MKMRLFVLAFLVCVLSASAADKAQLDNRIRKLTYKFEALQAQTDNRVPARYLRQAKGIILLDRTKAGFLFAYQGGSGVALVREPNSGKWSPVGFLSANEASLGFQIGGEQNFFVILLMNTNATRMLTEPSVDVAGEARGTAGEQSSGVEGEFSSTDGPVLVYSQRNGLYGGADIKAGQISPDEDADEVYYGQFLTMKDILFGQKVKPTEAARNLAEKINEYSRKSEP